MNNTKLNCSLNDTTILRNLILDNPKLPLLIFCGEDAYNPDYSYAQADVNIVKIETLTLYKDEWRSEDDYREELVDDLCDEEEYKNLSDEEYEKMIDEKVRNTEFVQAIVIYVG